MPWPQSSSTCAQVEQQVPPRTVLGSASQSAWACISRGSRAGHPGSCLARRCRCPAAEQHAAVVCASFACQQERRQAVDRSWRPTGCPANRQLPMQAAKAGWVAGLLTHMRGQTGERVQGLGVFGLRTWVMSSPCCSVSLSTLKHLSCSAGRFVQFCLMARHASVMASQQASQPASQPASKQASGQAQHAGSAWAGARAARSGRARPAARGAALQLRQRRAGSSQRPPAPLR